MKNLTLPSGLVIFAAILASGCANNNSIYYWGGYEQLLYEMYVEPGVVDPTQHIEKIGADIEEAENSGKPIPPGVFAHLGMMHATLGSMNQALEALETEKALYPESTVLVDGMIQRATSKVED